MNLTLVSLLLLVVALAVILSPRLITPSDGLLPSYSSKLYRLNFATKASELPL
jgi:hypothetical protein